MKTITEFSGFTLKEALAKKTALLAEGKTDEEAMALIHEMLKLADETKIAFYKNAVDMTQSRMDRVKRVVVATKSSETEKVPEEFSEREGHFYLVEFFPQSGSRVPARGGREDFGGRGGSSRGRGGRDSGGRDGGGRGRGDGERRPSYRDDAAKTAAPVARPEGAFAKRDDSRAALVPQAPAANRRSPRDPNRARPAKSNQPRAPRAPVSGPKGAGELRLVLKGQSSTTLQGSAPAVTATSSTETQSTESTQP